MADALEKARTLLRNRTTYGAGLLQTKAYRALKQRTDELLAPHSITSVHWAFLGLIFENDHGLRFSEAARELDVEAPFVTALSNRLIELDLIEVRPDPDDSRAKRAFLTKAGTAFVRATETRLRRKMRSLLTGTALPDILSYLLVLERIVQNSK